MAYRFLGPIFTQIIIIYCFLCALINLLLWTYPKLPNQEFRSSQAHLHIALFSFIVFQIQLNYFITAIRGPGFVKKKWTELQKLTSSEKQYLQYCKQCNEYKAPRSHHCRRLERCCLKMDHYCPWTGTTIGLYNQAPFIRFLFFVPIGCIWACIIICKVSIDQLYLDNMARYKLYQTYGDNYVAFTQKALIFNFIGFGGALGTTIAVSFLLYQQIKVLLTNKTTIEKWICTKAEDRQEYIQNDLKLDAENESQEILDQVKPFVYPYDLGKWTNFKQVLNWHGFKNSPCCKGYLDWPVLENCGQFDLTIEQLSQKQMKKAMSRNGTIIKNYSGWWLPFFDFGFKTGCIKIPISDENRLKLDVNKDVRINVTRGYNDYWWYGQFVDEKGRKRKETRGWFPKACVKLDPIHVPEDFSKKEQ